MMTDETRYRPGQLAMDRKTRFARLNAFITERGGWITSIPGDSVVTFDALEESSLPESLRRAGYDVREIGVGQRIIPSAIVVQMTLNSAGELVPLVEGSTSPVASVVTHAGIRPVRKYEFGI